MQRPRPHIVILAGPNGAGKSTAAPRLLKGALRVAQFVNADVIARGLAGFDADSAAFEASRIMLDRINALACNRVSFAFETTLAARSLAPWLRSRMTEGYKTDLVYLWPRSEDMAVARVGERVRRGGHSIPEETVRRRFRRSLKNLTGLYMAIVSAWRVYNNSGERPRLIARGEVGGTTEVRDPQLWRTILEQAHDSAE